MRTETRPQRAAAAEMDPAVSLEAWPLDVNAHRAYIKEQLQKGLLLLNPALAAETHGGSAVERSFMELLLQQDSLLSGVYWLLCCLALTQPSDVILPCVSPDQQHATASMLPLPPEIRDALLHACTKRFLRTRHCSGLPPAEAATASPSPPHTAPLKAEGTPTYSVPEMGAPPTSCEGTAPEAAALGAFAALQQTTTAQAAAEMQACTHRCAPVTGFCSNLAEGAAPAALPTCSGLQVLALLGALPLLSEETLRQVRRFVLRLQRWEDGAFSNTLPPCCSSHCSDGKSCNKRCCAQSGAAAEPAGGSSWEHEGDIRCTFCCLLSLKLIHAAATSRERMVDASTNVPRLDKAAAFRARADAIRELALARPAAEHALVDIPAAVGAGAFPQECGEHRISWDASSHESYEAASWEEFLMDPFAGVRVDAVISWLLSLVGTDGGVGVSPGAEPHAGAAFCFAGCLALLRKRGALGRKAVHRLERWLCERQLSGGAIQGRPGKAGDSCYTFWVTAALLLLGKDPVEVLRSAEVAEAVAAAQHPNGGISRAHGLTGAPAAGSRISAAGPSDNKTAEHVSASSTARKSSSSTINSSNSLQFLSVGVLDAEDEQLRHPDPFHTFFALAGLSLLAHSDSPGSRLQWKKEVQETQQKEEWQVTCQRLLQPLDPATALPLRLSTHLIGSSASL
ncbi:uncharacterized protein LOC34618192 [Cyclospora cayetanensis]|uniref:Geranylgeranyl transferase type II subunit beta n=2 Tax=Cyclospora cayetanensis TaxID=88456 RepID=A0A1D3CYK5_9EIME|nr:uncharacterized protein LOC34618192 [Cyclospora cayetanensis]OEH76281.1 geranylgeranyl transferase type II beta [Cyclospora cayetanensis]